MPNNSDEQVDAIRECLKFLGELRDEDAQPPASYIAMSAQSIWAQLRLSFSGCDDESESEAIE